MRATSTSRLPNQHERFSHRASRSSHVTTSLFCQYICMMELLAWPLVDWGHRRDETSSNSWDSDDDVCTS